MKKSLLSILFLSVGCFVLAQSPIINQNNVYLLGDNVSIAICANQVLAGESGENITWDMSGLTEEEEQAFSFVSPSITPWSSDFETSTLCGINETNYYSYYKVDNFGLTIEGYAGFMDEAQNDSLKIVYSDSEAFIPLPLHFGDNHFDAFSGTSYFSGFTVPFTGEIDFEVDGYGTLLLPNGTYENVVRYHFTREQNNTAAGITTTQTKEQWAWISADFRFWLLLMEVNNNGFSNEELVWYAKNPEAVALSTKNVLRESIRTFPNPIEAGQDISFEARYSGQATFTLFDISGRLVTSESLRLDHGQNTVVIPPHADKGLYFMEIRMDQKVMVSRIVVQ